MVLKEYGSDIASQIFTLNHFRGNSGYRWSKALRRFSTPALRRMKSNKSCDHNLPAINILMKRKQQKEAETEKKRMENAKEEEAKKKKSKSKKSLVEDAAKEDQAKDTADITDVQAEDSHEPNLVDDATIHTEVDKEEDSLVVDLIKSKQLEQMAGIQQDADMEDMDASSMRSGKPFDINFQDSASVTSTLTNKSTETKDSVLTGGSRSTIASDDVTFTTKLPKYGISTSIIEKFAKDGIKNGITPQQLELQVQQYQALKFNKAKLAASAAVAKFLQNTTLSFPSNTKDDSSQPSDTVSDMPSEEATAEGDLHSKPSSNNLASGTSNVQTTDKDAGSTLPPDNRSTSNVTENIPGIDQVETSNTSSGAGNTEDSMVSAASSTAANNGDDQTGDKDNPQSKNGATSTL